MFRKRILCLLLLLTACAAGSLRVASAAEVDCDTTYCFTQEDFSQSEDPLAGICITGLPDASTGTVMLGTRVLRSGDILTAAQISQMTFVPLDTEADQEAVVTFLPIYEDRVETSATMTISIKGRTNQPPVAEDQAMETYKNLENTATLKARDPEGQALTYTVIRQPRRGTLTVHEDGSFTYTPKKNKVGTDSFTYTATDPAGNVSREATVTITVLKPTDAPQYADTTLSQCRFAAEWLKNTGLFTGEQINGQLMFQENRPVSRGEFLAMTVQLLGIPVDAELTTTVYDDEIPAWLQPYLAAALRSGMTSMLESTTFGADEAITGDAAAVMLCSAMDLSVSTAAGEDWDTASLAVAAMAENGIDVHAGQELNRGQVAVLLYQISLLAEDAPGLQMYR